MLYEPIKKAPALRSFKIADPYNSPGIYRKAQLHLHTSNSIDVRKKIPVDITVKAYKDNGYNYLVITDHDTVTVHTRHNAPDFLVVPGTEKLIPFLFRPLGKHLIIIGSETGGATADTVQVPTVNTVVPAHPNWEGNLGTGRWYLQDLLNLRGLKLMEIFNRHSDTAADIRLWHKILEKKGAEDPVWGVAVDDSDNAVPINKGWIMIKTPDLSVKSFTDALRKGCFYSTTGPLVDFKVENDIIITRSKEPAIISYINNQNKITACFSGPYAEYKPAGNEGFVRVEVTVENGGTAWSQPFFLLPP